MSYTVAKFKELIDQVSSRRYFALAALFAFAVFFIGLGSRHIGGGDEPRVAGIAAETLINGNWVEPKLNNKSFLEKPPLYFWADALSMKIFGRNDFGAKFPSALAAFCGAISLFFLARGLAMSGFGAMMAVVMLSTAAQYWNYGRKCMIDIFVACFVALAIWAFWELINSDKTKKTILWFIFFTLSLGGAIYSKGLVGLALPCSALFFYLAIDDFYLQKKFNLKRWIYLFAGAALSFIPVAIWVWFLYKQSGSDAVYTVVWTNNFGRFFGSHPDHNEPFWYYLRKLPEQLQPWTILLPFAIWFNFIRFKKHKDNKALFMLCWLLIPYLLLAISSGKRQAYVLPLYAAEVMLIANMLDYIYHDKLRLPAKWDHIDILTRILVVVFSVFFCLGGLGSLGIAIAYKLHWSIYIVPVILVLVSCWIIMNIKAKNVLRIGLGLLIGLAAVYITIDTAIRPLRNHKKSYQQIFEYCQKEIDNGKTLYLYRDIEREAGAALFYLGKNCPRFCFTQTKVTPDIIVLINARYAEGFTKAGFKMIKEYKVNRRKYWIMKHE